MYSMLMAVFVLARMLLQGFYLPERTLGDQPVHITSASSLTLWRSLCSASAGTSAPSPAQRQITQLIEVMLVGRGGDEAVDQAHCLSIDNVDASCPEVPLIAFLGLMHLRIALLLFVLGRAGCLNDGGIHQKCPGHHDACFGQLQRGDGLEQLTGQLMLLEQVAENS